MKAFKITVFLILFAMFLCGCSDNLTATSSSIVTSTESIQNNNSSEAKNSSQNVTSKKESSETTTTSKNTTSKNTTSKNITSNNNTTTSTKNQSNTSSVNNVINIPEKPVCSYIELEKKAEEILRKNSKYSEPANVEYYYELGGNFPVIPTEFLTVIPQYCNLTTVIDNGKEYVSSVDICQYKDYIYSSKVLEAIKRDLKIVEEFAGIKPTNIVFKNVKDNATFKNISDIPEDYFKTFSRGSHLVTNITVYFEDNNKINPRKVVASFDCYTSSINWVAKNRVYNYSVDLYVNYNRDIPVPIYW